MRPSRRQTQPFIRRWTSGRPSATALLVAITVGGYVAQELLQYMLAEHEQANLLWQWLALDRASVISGEYWKFISYSLLHSHPAQVIVNMALLFYAGREVESIVGARHFLTIYGAGVLLGGAVSCYALPGLPVVGTTPAVLAVVVAFATILPELEATRNLFFVLPLRVRAKWFALALMIMSGVMWATLTPPQIGAPGMVAAGVFSWFYVKQLGFGNPLAIQRYIFNRRQRAARLERMNADQFMSSEIDPILDKISREGMHSLSRAERKILALGREKIAGRTTATK
ncbi:MAG: rhomboid family intramembrane serine protease [Chthoniobacteraceae bacterium]